MRPRLRQIVDLPPLGTLAVHEAGHACMARHFGVAVHGVIFTPLIMRVSFDSDSLSLPEWAVVVAAGCAAESVLSGCEPEWPRHARSDRELVGRLVDSPAGFLGLAHQIVRDEIWCAILKFAAYLEDAYPCSLSFGGTR